MNTTIKKIGTHMPQYYKPPKNWKDRGEILITYKPIWRNIPIIRGFPFWVGNTIRFHITIQKHGEGNSYAQDCINETIDNELIEQYNIEGTDIEIISSPIPCEGNIRFSLGIMNIVQKNDPLILTANVQNKDRYWFVFVPFILGIIGTIIAGILLGFIQIEPFLRLLIEP